MDDRDDIDTGEGSSRVQRACDSCRTRKIRCDRGTPCSNCKASRLNCQTTAPTQKVQRQRVHISDEYERKIDRIEDRLGSIEQVLESLANKLGDLDIHKGHAEQAGKSRSSKVGKSPSSTTDIIANSPAPFQFEGETTLNVQSEFARELLEKAVGSTPSIGQNIEVQAALASLQSMVSRQGQLASTRNESQPLFNKALADLDGAKLERPPWEAVADALEKASIYPTMCFAVLFPFLKLQNLIEIFQEAYQSPDETSTGRRILVYGVLYNLFAEFGSFPLLGERTEHFKAYATQCQMQMESAMAQLDLFLPASYENILALLLAASYTAELCKPSVCWVMTSTAASLCQSLGYHQISSMKDDTEEERSAKINVFWFIYALDKTLSLRLGRASAIQDWDMSLPYPVPENKANPSIPSVPKQTGMQIYWIKVAQLQGQVYERLFSPAAFLKPPEERAQMAQELVDALNQAWADRGEGSVLDFTFLRSAIHDSILNTPLAASDSRLPSKRTREGFTIRTPAQIAQDGDPQPSMSDIEGSFKDVGELFYHSDVVMHYSTITLIQRAATTKDNFNQDCLESARAALLAHQRCSQQFNTQGNEDLWSGYVHWSVLQAPFTPFIVIFCYAISACSHSDLASLSDFVLSLESCRNVSEAANKLYKLCHMFLQVAKVYVEAKTKEAAPDNASPSQTRSNLAQRSADNGGYYVTEDGQHLNLDGVNQFDPYLSALGLVSNQTWPMASFAPMQLGLESFPQTQGMEGGGMTGNQNPVQDWFSGSRYIMGLLEEDINMPDLQNLQ